MKHEFAEKIKNNVIALFIEKCKKCLYNFYANATYQNFESISNWYKTCIV